MLPDRCNINRRSRRKKDAKIVAVPQTKVSQEFGKINDIIDLTSFFREKLEHFIKHHKDMESGKFVKIVKWEEKSAASELYRRQ